MTVLGKSLRSAILTMIILAAIPPQRLAAYQFDRASELSGMTVSEIAEISDSEPVKWQDEIMLRLWYRCLRQPRSEFERTLQFNDRPSPETWTNDTSNVRMRIFRIEGRLRTLRNLTELSQDELGTPAVAEIELASGQLVQVGAIAAPQLLPRNQPLDEPVAALGFFVRLSPPSDGLKDRSAIMIAPRLEWYPHRQQSSPLVSASHLKLAVAGFDLGLLDLARQYNRQSFQAEERPAFSEMLRAINRSTKTHPSEQPSPPVLALGLMDVLRAPDATIGEVVSFQGNVKRVTPVDFELDDMARTKIRYYQIDLFAPIGDGKIRMRNTQGEEMVFQHRFPVTVNAVDLPAKLIQESTGPVDIEGYFYRFWNYESEQSANRGGQFTPLIFATVVTPVELQTQTLDTWLTILLLSLLGLVVGVAVYYYRADWRRNNRLRQRN